VAAQALANLRQPTADVLRALIEALTDPQPLVRSAFIQALVQLGKLSTSEVQEALIGATQHAHPRVRAGAIQTLGDLAQPTPKVVAAIISALGEPSPPSGTDLPTRLVAAQVRYSAALALVALGETKVDQLIETLKDALVADASWRTQEAAARALVRLGE